MNDFFFYEQLCLLENIAGSYADGKQKAAEIRKAADDIAGQMYRVAVVGEFKRGKSSLINALIGSNTLPANVLPTTATITRVTYSPERYIRIHFHDGHTENRTVEELAEYATKLDRQSEINARSIREIVVGYPSVLCKNHVDILDTPGLNDNESMSEVTFSVLDNIDAAIVVVSAMYPLSITEQELILSLMERQGIRHILFVVSFIDELDSDEEIDRILALIKKRLSENVLDRARVNFAEKPEVLNKSEKMLAEPVVFGVSSRQALNGFIRNDSRLLKASRFSLFKEELLAFLTAAQTGDLPFKTAALVKDAGNALPGWKDREEWRYRLEMDDAAERLDMRRRFVEQSRRDLSWLMQKMDEMVEQKGIIRNQLQTEGFENTVRQAFIREISRITVQNHTHENIREKLETAARWSENYMREQTGDIRKGVTDALDYVVSGYRAMRIQARLEEEAFPEKTKQYDMEHPFPVCALPEGIIEKYPDLRNVNVIPEISARFHEALQQYRQALDMYIKGWRVFLLRMNEEDLAEVKAKEVKEQANWEKELHALEINFQKHMAMVADMKRQLRERYGDVGVE